LGVKQLNEFYFDTLKIVVSDVKAIENEALKQEVNFRYFKDQSIGISIDETTSAEDIKKIVRIFASALNKKSGDSTTHNNRINWPRSEERRVGKECRTR